MAKTTHYSWVRPPPLSRQEQTRKHNVVILIAIGANLPTADGRHPRATCRAAVEALRSLPGLTLAAVSPWHTTPPDPPPVPPDSQPDYCNGVARLEGRADPAWLLARLHAIEAAAGRHRTVPNAARTLDLDIIAIDDLLRDAPDPILPHPRAHLRRFVLAPLAQVAPHWRHPRLGLGVGQLLAQLPPPA
ncbi:MAG: 2-amino-4-hydroxy-6-hydroxymethyldihydropteridine diphosphokinase [Acetobacteraceae bacterium]|nr:2-amino-4-hydroxy-6-hydroxymethyldihydropteridine diphosphokinase [Acetobacteraceae bacterium]